MGLGVSTKKRAFYDNSVRVKIFDALLCQKHKQNLSCSSSERLVLWVPPQAERGGCMQGNGLEKESCAQLPHLVLFQAYSSEPETKENRWISEARMQDHQDSGVAVSHQKYDIFNSDRFPHACCGTLMLPWRRRRRHPEDDPLESWGNSQSHGRASRAGFCSFTHLSALSPGVCRDVFCGLKMPGTSPAE